MTILHRSHKDDCLCSDDELTHTELLRLHDRNYEHNKITRERGADDIVFYNITQWDESTIGGSNLGFKGEFDVIRKAGRQVLADLSVNQVQLDFEPEDYDDETGGDLVDGYYRSIDRLNSTVESYETAKQETMVCGVGAWELYTKYEINNDGENRQTIRRRPLHEANNNVFWDNNAVMSDKSDAQSCSILTPYSKSGLKRLIKDLTGRDEDIDLTSFSNPEHSYTFPWISGKSEIFYVGRIYHVSKVKDNLLELESPLGEIMLVQESKLADVMDDLIDDGYKINKENTRKIMRNKVMLYIVNAREIIKSYVIAGDKIPVVPMYGERAMVEGEEHYEGLVRRAKDPQRLRNFNMSYLADIVSSSPRPKPIFWPEQIQGVEWMYEETGADNNYPYYLMQRKDAGGDDLPLGPIAQMPEQTVPNALMQSIQLSREAVSDVAPANVNQDLSDVDLSGKAITKLQARLDDQSVVYQDHFKSAIRRDGEIFAGMMACVIDTPRKLRLVNPDGSTKTVDVMQSIVDKKTGDLVVINDITSSTFNVYAKIGQSYTSKQDETFEKLGELAVSAAAINPALSEMFLLKQAAMLGGINMDDVRDYSRKQLIIKGYSEPDDDIEEEMKWAEEAAQAAQQQQDPNAIAAAAEQAKADAAMAEVQRKSQADQYKVMTDSKKIEVSQFDAQTKRLSAQIDAQKYKADVDFKRIDAMTKRIDAVNSNRFRASINNT